MQRRPLLWIFVAAATLITPAYVVLRPRIYLATTRIHKNPAHQDSSVRIGTYQRLALSPALADAVKLRLTQRGLPPSKLLVRAATINPPGTIVFASSHLPQRAMETVLIWQDEYRRSLTQPGAAPPAALAAIVISEPTVEEIQKSAIGATLIGLAVSLILALVIGVAIDMSAKIRRGSDAGGP